PAARQTPAQGRFPDLSSAFRLLRNRSATSSPRPNRIVDASAAGGVIVEQILYVGAAPDFDKANLVVGIKIEEQNSLKRLAFPRAVHFDLGGGGKTGAFLVTAIAQRLDPELAHLLA